LLGGNNLCKYASNPIGWVDPLGLSPNKNSKTKGNSATTNETNSCCDQDPCASLTDVQWSNHGNKHVPAPNLSWQKIIESTGHQGKAKYKPGVNIKALEMTAWSTGTKINAGAGKNSVWKVFKAPDIIGANDGKETEYMRVECSQGVIHGHPISKTTHDSYIKRPK
jgi:hypothetical protein